MIAADFAIQPLVTNGAQSWFGKLRDVGRKALITVGEVLAHSLLVALTLLGMRALQALIELLWEGEELRFINWFSANDLVHVADFLLLSGILVVGCWDLYRAVADKVPDWPALRRDLEKTSVAAVEWCRHCLVVAVLLSCFRALQLLAESTWLIKKTIQTGVFVLLLLVLLVGGRSVIRAYRG